MTMARADLRNSHARVRRALLLSNGGRPDRDCKVMVRIEPVIARALYGVKQRVAVWRANVSLFCVCW